MMRLFSSRKIIISLERHGFVYVSQRGSHVKLHKKTRTKTLVVIVPANKKEIPAGTLRSILRQAQLSAEDLGVL